MISKGETVILSTGVRALAYTKRGHIKDHRTTWSFRVLKSKYMNLQIGISLVEIDAEEDIRDYNPIHQWSIHCNTAVSYTHLTLPTIYSV